MYKISSISELHINVPQCMKFPNKGFKLLQLVLF